MGRYCIVGAGPSGLSAARAFAAQGLEFDLLDRHARVGGLWDLENPGTPMYSTAHLVTSRELTAFVGFPMTTTHVDFPGQAAVHDYIRGFGAAFALERRFQGGSEVTEVAPSGDGWKVSLSNAAPRTYDGIVLAPGFQWIRHFPLDGLEGFSGEIIHSADYDGPADFADRRILIIGGGNSAADLAVDAAHVAAEATWSLRRGRWFIPKYLNGLPSDYPEPQAIAASATSLIGLKQQTDLARVLLERVGPARTYGLPEPDHLPLERAPIIGTHVLHYMAHGDLRVVGAVMDCKQKRIIFDDGREGIFDIVVLASGYVDRVPFLTGIDLDWSNFIFNAFHPAAPNLCVIGNLNSELGGFWVADLISQLAAHLFKAREEGSSLPWYGEVPQRLADRPCDLTGGARYAAMPWKSPSVHGPTFLRALKGVADSVGCELEFPEPWRVAL